MRDEKMTAEEKAEELEERLEILNDAKDKLQEVVNGLRRLADETGNGAANAYLVDQLAVHIDDEQGFLSREHTIAQWIEELENGEGDEEDEEDEDEDEGV